MYIRKISKAVLTIAVFTFITLTMFLLPTTVNAEEFPEPYYASHQKDAYRLYGENVFFDPETGCMCWAQRYQNNTATLCYATVGFRVFYGYNKTDGYVDLALFKNNGTYIVPRNQEIRAGAFCSDDEPGNDGYFYILWWIDYSQLQKATVKKYGATSYQAQYVSPPEQGNKTFHVIADSIMTASVNGSLQMGSCSVAPDLSSVSFSGHAYADESGMQNYWKSLTGQVYNDEIAASYNKPYDWQISAYTPPFESYTQTTHHVKKIGNTDNYTASFKNVSVNRSPGSYYTPQWTTTPTGYAQEKIDAGYIVTKAQETYARYRPIKYTINYLPNTAT